MVEAGKICDMLIVKKKERLHNIFVPGVRHRSRHLLLTGIILPQELTR